MRAIKTFLLIIFIIALLGAVSAMVYFMYRFYQDNQAFNNKLDDLSTEITTLRDEIDELKSTNTIDDDISDSTNKTTESSTDNQSTISIDVSDNKFEINSQNKFIITTDYRWTTMQNDGGSNTSIYYQIDLDNNTVSKVKESTSASLLGSSSKKKDTIYTKNLNTTMQQKTKNLLNNLIALEDKNENNNYNFFTVSGLNIEKNIYNETTIGNIKLFLQELDGLN